MLPPTEGSRPHLCHRLATATNCASPAILAIGLNARSVTFLGGVPGGSALIHAWISGWSLRSARMDPTRMADTPSLAAMAARLFTAPSSSSRCHASACASSPVIGGGSVGTGFAGFLVPWTVNRLRKFVLVSGLGR